MECLVWFDFVRSSVDDVYVFVTNFCVFLTGSSCTWMAEFLYACGHFRYLTCFVVWLRETLGNAFSNQMVHSRINVAGNVFVCCMTTQLVTLIGRPILEIFLKSSETIVSCVAAEIIGIYFPSSPLGMLLSEPHTVGAVCKMLLCTCRPPQLLRW